MAKKAKAKKKRAAPKKAARNANAGRRTVLRVTVSTSQPHTKPDVRRWLQSVLDGADHGSIQITRMKVQSVDFQ